MQPEECQWKGLQGARRAPRTVSMEGTPGGRRAPRTVSSLLKGLQEARRAPRRMQMRLKSVRWEEKTPIILKIIYTGHKNKFVERIL